MQNHPFFTTSINQYDESIKSMAPTVINGQNVILSQEQQRIVRDTLNTSIVDNPFAFPYHQQPQQPQILCAQKQFIPGGVLFSFQSSGYQQSVNLGLETGCACTSQYIPPSPPTQYQLPANTYYPASADYHQFNVEHQQQVKFHHDRGTLCQFPVPYHEGESSQTDERICISQKCERRHVDEIMPAQMQTDECACIIQKCERRHVDEIMPAQMQTDWSQSTISVADSENNEKPKKKRWWKRRKKTDVPVTEEKESRKGEQRKEKKKLEDKSSQTTISSGSEDEKSQKEKIKLKEDSSQATVSSESEDSVKPQRKRKDSEKRKKNKQEKPTKLKDASSQTKVPSVKEHSKKQIKKQEVEENKYKGDSSSKSEIRKNREQNPSQTDLSGKEASEKSGKKRWWKREGSDKSRKDKKEENRSSRVELKDCASQTDTAEKQENASDYDCECKGSFSRLKHIEIWQGLLAIPALVLLLWTFADSAKVISTSTCKCWQDYQAEIGESGLQCVALDQFHVMPCNMPKLPKCECSDGVSSILKDESGTWCTKYTKGEELMRWPCENVREWDEFFRKNPNLL